MCDYVEEEISLPESCWALLEHMAKQQGITLNDIVNNILREQLDKFDELEAAHSSKTVEGNDGAEEGEQQNP